MDDFKSLLYLSDLYFYIIFVKLYFFSNSLYLIIRILESCFSLSLIIGFT